MVSDADSEPPLTARSPYPSRSALPARVAAGDEPIPDDAATALDRPRFTAEMLAHWPTAADRPATSAEAAGEGATTIPSAPRASVETRRAWAASVVAAVLFGGLFGTLFGVWLATR